MKINRECKAELKKAETLNEVLAVLDDYYDFDEPLSGTKKGTVMMGITKILKILKPDER